MPRRPTTSGGDNPANTVAPHDPPDSVLIARVKAGEGRAFGELLTRYQDRIFNACWRICGHLEDARDITQETFLHAYRSLGEFRLDSRFYTWLYRIAVNLAISHQRRMRYRATVSLDGAPDSASESQGARILPDGRGVTPFESAARAEGLELLADAIQRLDDDHRAVVVLRDIEGLNYAEIAEVLNVPVGTVRSRLHRARTELVELTLGPVRAGVERRAGSGF